MNSAVRKNRVAYTEEILQRAVEDVRSGVPINTASRIYKIPRSTLHSKIINKYASNKPGGIPVINTEEEEKIVEWIDFMCTFRRPVVKEHVVNSVALLVKKLKRPNKFVDGRPGKHWCELFFARHPGLRDKMRHSTRMSKYERSVDGVNNWFLRTRWILKTDNLEDALPSRIFSIGETALPLNLRNNPKTLSVIVTVNAVGGLAPTMIICDSKSKFTHMKKKLPAGWAIGRSEDGTTTPEILTEYIEKYFYPWVVRSKIKLPVVLYLDEHTAYLTYTLTEFCVNHQIVLIAVPFGTGNYMQPVKAVLFPHLNLEWKKTLHRYEEKKNVSDVSKVDFGKWLNKTFYGINFSKLLVPAFRECGLYPFASDNVEFIKLLVKSEDTDSKDITKLTIGECTRNHNAFVEIFESYIDESTLEEFKSILGTSATPENVENINLFNIWKKIIYSNQCNKTHCHTCTQNKDKKLPESLNKAVNTDSNEVTVKLPDQCFQNVSHTMHNEEFNAFLKVIVVRPDEAVMA